MRVDGREDDRHWVQRWFSFGDLLSLVVMLVVFVGGYAQLQRDVKALQEDVTEMRAVQITPGAATRITSLETSMEWLRRSIEEDRRQSAEFRSDTRQQLARIESSLTKHSTADR